MGVIAGQGNPGLPTQGWPTTAGVSAPVIGTFTSKNILTDSLQISCAGYATVLVTTWPIGAGSGTFAPEASADGKNWYSVQALTCGVGSSTLTTQTTYVSAVNTSLIPGGTPTAYRFNVSGFNFFRVRLFSVPGSPSGQIFQMQASSAMSDLTLINAASGVVPVNFFQMGGFAVSSINIALQGSQTSAFANGTTTRTTTTGLGIYKSLDILLNITAGGTATTGTLAIFLEDSADGGTTWDDLVSSTVFTFGSAAATQRFMLQGAIATTITQGTPAATETLAAGTVRQGPWGDRIRVREVVATITGGSVGVTYTINAVGRVF